VLPTRGGDLGYHQMVFGDGGDGIVQKTAKATGTSAKHGSLQVEMGHALHRPAPSNRENDADSKAGRGVKTPWPFGLRTAGTPARNYAKFNNFFSAREGEGV
jgi:hypothetical protein